MLSINFVPSTAVDSIHDPPIPPVAFQGGLRSLETFSKQTGKEKASCRTSGSRVLTVLLLTEGTDEEERTRRHGTYPGDLGPAAHTCQGTDAFLMGM